MSQRVNILFKIVKKAYICTGFKQVPNEITFYFTICHINVFHFGEDIW